jgi:eukaryotic-like serine/threonine-protein kinase
VGLFHVIGHTTMTDVRTEQRSNDAPEDPAAEDFLPKVSQGGISSPLSVGPATHPRRIGSYQIISVLGRGGMGLVYLAQQQQPKRVVALKVINPGLTSLGHLRRLLREAEVLGRLQHPGIAQIHEAGTADSPDGSEPFIAMEYIRGQPITDYVQSKSLPIGSRLDLFAKVCDAIHHAHQQGIVHRDIKPANIMVDQGGQPKVLDFGVARLVDNDQRMTRQTEDGQFIGTLAYMSPEHASAKPDQIDIRSDIYALGVVLYEMLSGKMPYCVDGCSIVDAVRVIQENDPTRLSSVHKRYSGDIEVIVNKALEKNKDKRYQSAAELAADIRRHLNDQPILARAPSRAYQLQKFARRHKAFFLGLTAVFLTLIAGLFGTSWQAVRATRQEIIAKQNFALAKAEARESQLRLADGMVAQGNALLSANRPADARVIYTQAWDIFDKLGVSGLPAQLGVWDIDRQHPQPLRSFKSDSDIGLEIFVGNDMIASAKGPDILLHDALSGNLLHVLEGHVGVVTALTAAVQRHQIVSASSNGVVRVWDLSTGACIRAITSPNGNSAHVAISTDGIWALAAESHGRYGLWNLETGAPAGNVGHAGPAPGVIAISPDGCTFACAGADGSIVISDAAMDSPRPLLGHKRQIMDVVYAPDAKHIASASIDGTVRLWEVSSGKQIFVVSEPHHVRCLSFSHDGRCLALGCIDGTVKVCDASSGQQLAEFDGHESLIQHLSFSEDGRLLMSADETGASKIWVVDAGTEAGTLIGHSGSVCGVATAQLAPVCVSAGADGTVRVWDTATRKLLRILDSRSGPQTCVAISADGQTVTSAGSDGSLRVWDVFAGKIIRVLRCSTANADSVAISANGRTVFAAWDDGTVRCAGVADNGSARLLASGLGGLGTIVPSQDGSRLYCASDNGVACVSQNRQDCKITRLGVGIGTMYTVELSGDGKILASGGTDGQIRLWDIESGTLIRCFGGHTLPVSGLAFLNTGAIVSCDHAGAVRVWRVDDGSEIRTLVHNGVQLLGLKVASDHLSLFAGTAAGYIQMWDLACPTYDHAHHLEVRQEFDSIQENARSPVLAQLGAWYDAHEVDSWAVCLLERARRDHEHVSSLTLARCCWKLQRFDLAKQEFDQALQEADAPTAYIHLCHDAIDREQHGGL